MKHILFGNISYNIYFKYIKQYVYLYFYVDTKTSKNSPYFIVECELNIKIFSCKDTMYSMYEYIDKV